MERRTLLKSVGVGAVTALAGCLGDDDGGIEDYPNRDINITIPWSEGGGTDIYVRQLAPAMARVADVNFIIENIPGAGSATGTGSFITGADPDGYDILANNIPPMVGPILETQPDWSPQFLDLVGIYTYGTNAVIVIAPPDVAETFDEFMDGVRSGDIPNVSTTGPGSTGMAITNLLNTEDEYDIEEGSLDWVPYESGGEAVRAVIQGEVPASIVTGTAAAELYDGSNFNALASCSSQGMSQFPDMPTWEELGYSNIDFIGQTNRQLWFPPDTPSEFVEPMADIVAEAVDDEEFQEWTEESGNPTSHIGPGETDDMKMQAVEIYPDIYQTDRPEGW